MYQNLKITDKEKSIKEITGSISAEKMNELRGDALKKITQTIELDGFRKGKAPQDKVLAHVGETRVLEEAAHIALSQAYPAIITEHGIEAIGHPHVAITKLAPGNDLEFKITTAVVPEVTLGDYKSIAKKIRTSHKDQPSETTEKELQETIDQVRKNIAMQRKIEAQKNFKPGEENTIPEVKDEDLPELTDEFVKTLGDFKDVEDFKTKIKANIKLEKERKAKESRRQAIAEALIENATIDVPEIIIEAEQEKMIARMKDDVERAGLKFEEYLEKIKKSEDDLKKEWKEAAEKKAKMQLILNKIIVEEKLEADTKQVENEIKQMKQFYPDANEMALRTYIESYLLNEKVFQILESAE